MVVIFSKYLEYVQVERRRLFASSKTFKSFLVLEKKKLVESDEIKFVRYINEFSVEF